MTVVVTDSRFRATGRYGEMAPYARIFPSEITATCPVPGCGKTVRLYQRRIETHANSYGFSCDGVALTLQEAAALRIDAAGRLIGVDEMRRPDAAD